MEDQQEAVSLSMSKTIKKTFFKAAVFVFAAGILVLFDQWTKVLAVEKLKNGTPYIIFEKVLEFRYLENTGAAFGMMKGMQGLIKLITPVICLIMSALTLRLYDSRRMRPLCCCFLLITAGAVGNFIDRLANSYVVDFIYVSLIDFPIFNVADIYVTCGSIILILLLLFKYKEEDFDRRNTLQQ